MLLTNGSNLKAALDTIEPDLSPSERKQTTNNAVRIVSAIVNAYEDKIKIGEVGKYGRGPTPNRGRKTKRAFPSGLVYGRIQSGKTRAMITSAALALDNKFSIVVVVTSDNNRLVGQTHSDFQRGLPGSIPVYSKSDFRSEVEPARQILQSDNGGIVIVCSKGKARLTQAIEFLKKIGASNLPSIIFDDEGDQATLDTNNYKRSKKGSLIPSSKIHQLIHDPTIDSLRNLLNRHVFVAVTGTPSGIILQNIDDRSRPSFIELLPPGRNYVGGDTFFNSDDPTRNPYISLIDGAERIELLSGELPDGLKSAIKFFLLAASNAGHSAKWPNDGFKFLCHPSVKNDEQEVVAELVRAFLTHLDGILRAGKKKIDDEFSGAFAELSTQNNRVAPLSNLLNTIRNNLRSRQIVLLNKNTTSDAINYSRYFNFLIGGNTLGRGLAIKNLLVTYYVREARVTQMDTMYQHARMFGYRGHTLRNTKVFLPPQLYGRFRQIHISDQNLRNFIEKHKGDLDTFPVKIAENIRPTRRSVLDAVTVDVLYPGKQIYPNYPFWTAPQAGKIFSKVIKQIGILFPDYDTNGRKGKLISMDAARKLLGMVKTNGTNVWRDKKIRMIISYLAEQFADGVLLKYRTATRSAGDERGLLAQGVLAGKDVQQDSRGRHPVLWLFSTAYHGNNKPAEWNGENFIYPTLVLPDSAELIVFNKS